MARFFTSVGLLLIVAAVASNKTSSKGSESTVEAAKKQAGSYQAGATKQYAGAYQKYMSSGGQGGGSNLPKYAGGYVNKYAAGFKKYMNGKGQANGVGGSNTPGASSYGPGGYDKYYKKFMGGDTSKNGGSAGPGASSYGPGGYDHYYKQYMGGSAGQGGGAGGGAGGYDHYYKQYMGGSSGPGGGAGAGSSSYGAGGYDHYYKQYMGMGGGAAASGKSDKDASSSSAQKSTPPKSSQTKQAPPKSAELIGSHQKLRQQAVQKSQSLQEQLAADANRSHSTSWSLAAALGLVLTSVSALGIFKLHRHQRSAEENSQYFYLQA